MTFHIASLSDVERKSKEMHDIQAREDTLTIMNTGSCLLLPMLYWPTQGMTSGRICTTYRISAGECFQVVKEVETHVTLC
jgi:hypothetical protein